MATILNAKHYNFAIKLTSTSKFNALWCGFKTLLFSVLTKMNFSQ